MALRLNLRLQGVTTHYFGIQTFGRQKHDGVRGCAGRMDVFRADAVTFGPNRSFERLACGGNLVGASTLVGGLQALPVFAWELGIDGQQRLAGVARKADGKLNYLER